MLAIAEQVGMGPLSIREIRLMRLAYSFCLQAAGIASTESQAEHDASIWEVPELFVSSDELLGF
jgi:hypothetical protein